MVGRYSGLTSSPPELRRFTVTSSKHMLPLHFQLRLCYKLKELEIHLGKKSQTNHSALFHLFHPTSTCGERSGHNSITDVINRHVSEFLFSLKSYSKMLNVLYLLLLKLIVLFNFFSVFFCAALYLPEITCQKKLLGRIVRLFPGLMEFVVGWLFSTSIRHIFFTANGSTVSLWINTQTLNKYQQYQKYAILWWKADMNISASLRRFTDVLFTVLVFGEMSVYPGAFWVYRATEGQGSHPISYCSQVSFNPDHNLSLDIVLTTSTKVP